jgi:hypothetical protein
VPVEILSMPSWKLSFRTVSWGPADLDAVPEACWPMRPPSRKNVRWCSRGRRSRPGQRIQLDRACSRETPSSVQADAAIGPSADDRRASSGTSCRWPAPKGHWKASAPRGFRASAAARRAGTGHSIRTVCRAVSAGGRSLDGPSSVHPAPYTTASHRVQASSRAGARRLPARRRPGGRLCSRP